MWLANYLANVVPQLVSTDMLGAIAVGLAAFGIWAFFWHRRQRKEGKPGIVGYHLIIGGLVVVGVGFLAVALGLLYQQLHPSTAAAKGGEPIATGEAVRQENLIRGASFSLAGTRLSLQGTYIRRGVDLTVYVTYAAGGAFGTLAADDRPGIVGAMSSGTEPRIKIDTVVKFDRESKADITVGNIISVPTNQAVIQWGRSEFDNTKVGINWGHYFGWVILVENDGREDWYPFAIIARSSSSGAGTPDRAPLMPLIVGPDTIFAHSRMAGDARK